MSALEDAFPIATRVRVIDGEGHHFPVGSVATVRGYGNGGLDAYVAGVNYGQFLTEWQVEKVPALVGLIGKKRSGKDTFARGLILRGFRRFAFADNLKASALALDPIVAAVGWEEHLRLSDLVTAYGWEEAKERPEVRRTLQRYGVAIRELDPEFWIRSTMTSATRAPLAVITDVRFPNEVEAIRAVGGLIVRINRPGLVSTDEHISETALDDTPADITIENDGTAEDLVAKARAL